jgi:hypothetical protein
MVVLFSLSFGHLEVSPVPICRNEMSRLQEMLCDHTLWGVLSGSWSSVFHQSSVVMQSLARARFLDPAAGPSAMAHV